MLQVLLRVGFGDHTIFEPKLTFSSVAVNHQGSALIPSLLLTESVIKNHLQVAIGVVIVFLARLVVFKISHFFVIISIEHADFRLEGAKLRTSQHLMHQRGNSLAHHRAIKAQLDSRMHRQIVQKLLVTWPPVVLILLEFKVTAFCAVFIISPEQD